MRTSLPVPAAEDTTTCDVGIGTIADASTEEETAGAGGGGGGGGGSGCSDAEPPAAVCCVGTAAAIVDEVGSVGATADGTAAGVEVEVGVAAVRARERVHRLPFTVVTDS